MTSYQAFTDFNAQLNITNASDFINMLKLNTVHNDIDLDQAHSIQHVRVKNFIFFLGCINIFNDSAADADDIDDFLAAIH